MLPHSQILRSIRIVLWLICIARLSEQQHRTFEVVENSGENTVIGQLYQSGGVSYGFNGNCSSVFSIDESSVIRSIGNLDREVVVDRLGDDHPDCIVRYTNTSDSSVDLVLVTISVLDINDEIPTFFNLEQPEHIQIVENSAVPTNIIRLEPVDNDKDSNGTVVFSITGGDDEEFFEIKQADNDNSTSGTLFLFLRRHLDFEEDPRQFNISITISDQGDPISLSSTQVLLISVINSDDAVPTFATTNFVFEVFENHSLGLQHPIGNVSISNAQFLVTTTYSMILPSHPEAFDHFAIDATSGVLYLISKLDYERVTDTFFNVEATNPSIGASDNTRVDVNILNSNDELPYFVCSHRVDSSPSSLPCPEEGANADGMVFHIEEHSELDLPLYLPVFNILDNDSGSEFRSIDSTTAVFQPAINGTATLFSGHFTGVRISQVLDREEIPNITLFLTATNSAPPFLSGTAVIYILVDDKNDNAPIFTQNSYPARISENSPSGKEVVNVTANDLDIGENATVMYAIAEVRPAHAVDWFDIHSLTGTITTRGDLDYAALDEGTVVLTVSATDNGSEPLHSNATVTIALSPSVSFTRNSFQEYAGYIPLDGDGDDESTLYLELKTLQDESLLLYHHDRFTLAVEEGFITYREFEAGVQIMERTFTDQNIADDRWYSVLLQRNQENTELTVQLVDSDSNATSRLLDSTLSRCDQHEGPSAPTSLYLGGVDIFLLEPIIDGVEGFMGSIRNLLIDDILVDLGCPTREENIIQGMYSNPGVCEELTCASAHTTGCVSFAPEPYCSCQGGFTSQACNTENSYAPIRFNGNSKAELTLDYAFFYDLELNSQVPPMEPGSENSDNPAGGSVQRRKRRKRQGLEDDNEGADDIVQLVDMSFRILESETGTPLYSTLLYSKTGSSVSELKISNYDGNEATISYMVFDSSYTSETYIVFQVELKLEVLYLAQLVITNSGVKLNISNGVNVTVAYSTWNEEVNKFAEPPYTVISIGGATDPQLSTLDSFFTGCISRVAINNIELPLSGLLMAEDGGGFTTDEDGTVAPFCDLCDVVTCSISESLCTSDLFGVYECVCPSGTALVNDSCVPITTIVTGLQPVDEVSLPIYYIVAIAAAGLLAIGTFVILIICLVHRRKRKQKNSRIYHVSQSRWNDEESQSLPRSSKPNPYTNVVPRPEPSLSSTMLARCGSTTTHRSSVSTNDGGLEGTGVENTSRFTRRKSTTSAESGIKTDTDREDRSIGGMQSGNERDSEILSTASESEGFTTSGMETALSPSGVILAGGGSSECIMGVPVLPPLTPKERKAITPLRPESANLSLSEYESDLETDLSYDIHTPTTPSSRNGSVSKDNPRRSSDSDNSKVSEPKWYKSSTASDNERERERVMRTGAYYSPQRSYPPNQPRAPEYRSPPKFQEQKRSSPSHQNHSPRPYVNMVASPLTSNAHKYELHYPHSSMRHEPPRMLFHPHNTTNTTPDISRAHPMRYSQHRTPTHYNAHRQNSLSPSRPVYYNVVPGALPSSTKYHRSFSNDQPHPPLHAPTEQKFQDLKSVATINPIAFWEMQDRMKSEVDQVDPYQILSESYVQFEDVSTDPSVMESQTTLDMPDGPGHQDFEFSSQGGREGGADIDPLDISMSSQLQDDIPGGITHFPSADCSEEYATHTVSSKGTLVESSSEGMTPKERSSNYVIPSQEPFDV